MKFYTKEFWSAEEIRNVFIHAGFAFVIAAAGFIVFRKIDVGVFLGIYTGFLVEFFQYYYKKEGLKLEDRIRDLIAWVIGAFLPFITVFPLIHKLFATTARAR